MLVDFICCLDPSLGRIDKSTLSQQTLMELLIENIPDPKSIFGSEEAPADITQWKGLQLNDSQEITEIDWDFFGMEGSLSIQWLPETLRTITVCDNKFTQSIQWTQFPMNIYFIGFGSNRIHGEIDWDHLPPQLVELYMDENCLSGTVNLENLPQTLIYLNICDNSLTGSVCLTKLPADLLELIIAGNKLSGSIDLTHLPKGMEAINLAENDFLGETDFSALPESLENFHVGDTKLSGTIRVRNGKNFSAYSSNVKLEWIE